MPTLTTEKHHIGLGFSLVLLGAFGFSAKAIIIKLAYAYGSQVDAITLMALRMLFSLPIFLLVAFWHLKKTDSKPLDKRQWLIVVLLGLIGYYVSSYLDFTGLHYISAGLERVILFLYPTFVVLFSAWLYKRKITGQLGLALALSYAGMILIFIEQLSLTASAIWLGSALVLGSAVIFAFFTMGSGIMTHHIGSTRFTAYTMTVASIATLVHFTVQHGLAPISLPVEVYGLALIMAVFSTVLPAFLMNAGIRRIGAGNASVISTTGPISTLLLAFLVLHESVTVNQMAGTCLVLVGVYVVSRAK
ncbi:MAG: DMT family transporter [Methylovulum sp.]|nr:DMT family transporter [Methylovulum sp.]